MTHTNNDEVAVTTYHLDAAERYGQKVAAIHYDRNGEPVTDEELWDEYPEGDVVFHIMGAKTHEVPEWFLVLDSFEDGYFYWEGWDADDE